MKRTKAKLKISENISNANHFPTRKTWFSTHSIIWKPVPCESISKRALINGGQVMKIKFLVKIPWNFNRCFSLPPSVLFSRYLTQETVSHN